MEVRHFWELTEADIKARYERKSIPKKVRDAMVMNRAGTEKVYRIVSPMQPYLELMVFRKCNVSHTRHYLAADQCLYEEQSTALY